MEEDEVRFVPYAEGTAVIRHSQTDEVFHVEGEDLVWEKIGGEEREMGVEYLYEADIDHPELGILVCFGISCWW